MSDLDKRAKEYANKWLEEVKDLELYHKTDPKPEYIRIQEAYKDGATQETALLSQHILDLQKDKGKLTDKVRKLEQQIEKMKRCSICKYSSNLGYCKIRCNGGECNNYDKWELAND